MDPLPLPAFATNRPEVLVPPDVWQVLHSQAFPLGACSGGNGEEGEEACLAAWLGLAPTAARDGAVAGEATMPQLLVAVARAEAPVADREGLGAGTKADQKPDHWAAAAAICGAKRPEIVCEIHVSTELLEVHSGTGAPPRLPPSAAEGAAGSRRLRRRCCLMPALQPPPLSSVVLVAYGRDAGVGRPGGDDAAVLAGLRMACAAGSLLLRQGVPLHLGREGSLSGLLPVVCEPVQQGG